MRQARKLLVPELIEVAHAVMDDAQQRFRGLSSHQLNWKPAKDRWSVAQCLDHLVTSNTAYFPKFEQARQGVDLRTFWEYLPWYPKLWGRFLVNALDPSSSRRLGAPKVFRPAEGTIDESIVDRFVDQQSHLIHYMDATKDLDLERIIISSPVTRLIVYSLLDTYRMLIAHERRHLRQADGVVASYGFPN